MCIRDRYTTLPFFNTIYAYKNVFVGYAQPRDLLELENLQDEKIRESIKDLEEDVYKRQSYDYR